ncbi:MAG: OmpA family protein [Bacteriovorax sp.]|nr:OmpA family protein [Bacteriovorax sp.]
MKKNQRIARLKAQNNQEEHGDGNWLISYADMMTLLWGFFVIISAFSVPSKDLIEKVKESTSKAMGGKYEKPFNEITDELLKVLKEMNLEQETKIETLTDGVKLTIKSGSFFESGSSAVPEQTKEVLSKIAIILKKQDSKFRILVEGHTDDVPIKTLGTPSNWELSSNRAANVVRLFESLGVKHEVLRPIGFADVEPLVDITNLKDEELLKARTQNRRIVIRLQQLVATRLKGVTN